VLYEPSAADVHPPCDSSAPPGGTPFAGVFVTISKEEHIRLKCEVAYWRGRHERGLQREAVLKEKVETLQARVRDLTQRLFGRRSEKRTADPEREAQAASPRPRGQQPNSAGHGRTSLAHLPVRDQPIDLSAEAKCCPKCGRALEELLGSEDSEVVEIEVQAYRRRIRRKRYRPDCECEGLPGIVSAPAPARLIPKGKLGISIWVEVLLIGASVTDLEGSECLVPTNLWMVPIAKRCAGLQEENVIVINESSSIERRSQPKMSSQHR
jgi:hypothetical protein